MVILINLDDACAKIGSSNKALEGGICSLEDRKYLFESILNSSETTIRDISPLAAFWHDKASQKFQYTQAKAFVGGGILLSNSSLSWLLGDAL